VQPSRLAKGAGGRLLAALAVAIGFGLVATYVGAKVYGELRMSGFISEGTFSAVWMPDWAAAIAVGVVAGIAAGAVFGLVLGLRGTMVGRETWFAVLAVIAGSVIIAAVLFPPAKWGFAVECPPWRLDSEAGAACDLTR
jgi:hypothetical protein